MKKYSLHQGDNRNDIQQLSSTEIFSRSAEKFMVIWQVETKFKMLLGLSRRPTVAGQRPAHSS